MMATRLINTKSVLNYDNQAKEIERQESLKKMLSKGRIRAEQYSMLGKSLSGFSEKSVMSSTKSKDKLLAGHLSPLRKSLNNNLEQQMSSTRRSHTRNTVFHS